MALSEIIVNLVGISTGYVILGTCYIKFRSGAKPWTACMLDCICMVGMKLRLGPWGLSNSPEAILAKAMVESGLNDPRMNARGPTCIDRYSAVRTEGLRRSGARYSPTGYIIAQRTLEKRMKTRLRIADYLSQHPKAAAEEVGAPIFVVGFTRTGTTFLHEMLGLHPGVKMHYTWEQIEPVPRTNLEDNEALSVDRLQRKASNRGEFQATMFLAGDAIQSIHRIGYEEPEECTTPCAMELPWNIADLPLMAFASDVVHEMGGGEVFKWYRRYLQILSFQSDEANATKTWMLKCPFHLPYLGELSSEFPKSLVVWTHRNPVDCIGSACSLYDTIFQVSIDSWSLDKKRLGAAVLALTKQSLDRALKVCDEGKINILHLRYQDTTGDSKGICKKVFEHAGLAFTRDYEQKIEAYLSASKTKRTKEKKKGRAHSYSLSDYGLSDDGVRATFKDYIQRFNL